MDGNEDGLGEEFRSALSCLIVLVVLSCVFMVSSFIAFGAWF